MLLLRWLLLILSWICTNEYRKRIDSEREREWEREGKTITWTTIESYSTFHYFFLSFHRLLSFSRYGNAFSKTKKKYKQNFNASNTLCEIHIRLSWYKCHCKWLHMFFLRMCVCVDVCTREIKMNNSYEHLKHGNKQSTRAATTTTTTTPLIRQQQRRQYAENRFSQLMFCNADQSKKRKAMR